MYSNLELLSPAGNWDSLVAAVQNGADAVYLGGKLFSARQYAGNFTEQELKDAVRYCHIRDVKVYLTINTLLNDKEIEQLPNYIIYIYNIGIDAVIVQDIGVAKLIKKIVPDLKLHASTQMTIHNIEGVKVLEDMGFKRVVLGRELNMEQIRQISNNTNIEIEVFAHGALCSSYSGQCLMSSLIGGRSGNRGRCAQPCRLPYSLIDIGPNFYNSDSLNLINTNLNKENENMEKAHMLSLKDLCLINHINILKNLGINSLKIEGRMKRPEYVAIVTEIYRRYLDKTQPVLEEDYNNLLQIFNRDGFTSAYFDKNKKENMISYDKPNNWGVYIGNVSNFDKGTNRATINLIKDLNKGDGIEIRASNGKSYGSLIEKIKLKGLIKDSALKGDTIKINIKGDIRPADKVYKTSSYNLIKRAQDTYINNHDNKKISIYGNCKVELGQAIHINIWDNDNNFAEYRGEKLVEKAIIKNLTKEDVKRQLSKLGGTPYEFKSLEIDIKPGLFIPVNEINKVRRKAIEVIESKRATKYPARKQAQVQVDNNLEMDVINTYVKTDNTVKAYSSSEDNKAKLSVQVSNIMQFARLIDYELERIYIPADIFLNQSNLQKALDLINKCFNKGIETFCIIPRIFTDDDIKIYKGLFEIINQDIFTGIMIGNIGHIRLFKDTRIKIHGDFGLNLYNSISLKLAQELGLNSITLSPELNLGQIKDMNELSNIEKEVIVYGRLPLMILENCPIGSRYKQIDGKDTCRQKCYNSNYGLVDRKNIFFPIISNPLTCRAEVLNSKTLFVIKELTELPIGKISYIRLLFTKEEPNRCGAITNLYKDFLMTGYKTIEDKHKNIIDWVKAEGVTKGHFYRGVE